MLAFILSHGQEPLILDQPEDDLDNHLIFHLIVKALGTIKRRTALDRIEPELRGFHTRRVLLPTPGRSPCD